jgi:hypothetical protein
MNMKVGERAHTVEPQAVVGMKLMSCIRSAFRYVPPKPFLHLFTFSAIERPRKRNKCVTCVNSVTGEQEQIQDAIIF